MLSPGPIVEQIFRGDKSSVRKTAGVTKIIKPAGRAVRAACPSCGGNLNEIGASKPLLP
jgi:hypothetical protein